MAAIAEAVVDSGLHTAWGNVLDGVCSAAIQYIVPRLTQAFSHRTFLKTLHKSENPSEACEQCVWEMRQCWQTLTASHVSTVQWHALETGEHSYNTA